MGIQKARKLGSSVLWKDTVAALCPRSCKDCLLAVPELRASLSLPFPILPVSGHSSQADQQRTFPTSDATCFRQSSIGQSEAQFCWSGCSSWCRPSHIPVVEGIMNRGSDTEGTWALRPPWTWPKSGQWPTKEN